MRCQSCAKEVPQESQFCLGCGAAIHAASGAAPSQEVTAAAPASPAAAPAKTSAPSQSRFVPGTVLAERYRIIAQVGRGGMGEVYRADDLKLGQTVALKFLPVLHGKNPDDLAQLHREVRIARQISHPNVCRVFDIGDADGVPFITMEFVDGEDLASLMKRIGRLQPDKAIQLAQQLCAGLGEAHSFGVLHRDLKPANIMLDGRGNARITDFGLAIMAAEARGEDAWAGTPAYMAPEQLSGTKPTTQTDIYALGLVLYELFTGKEAYSGASLAEIVQQRQKGTPAKISGIVKGLDPAIEHVILQCLEKDPRSRPRTVQQIAAALPGGDPLAAMIAAGETPSPEMIAAAIDQRLTNVGRLWLMVAALAAAVVIFGYFIKSTSFYNLAPLGDPPEVMAARARDFVHSLGYSAAPEDTAYWYEPNVPYLQHVAGRFRAFEVPRHLRTAVPTPMRFIYRQSPYPLHAPDGSGFLHVTLTQPPDDTAGIVSTVLDGAGRLLYLSGVPPVPQTGTTAGPAPDWAPLLAKAGLEEKALVPATPRMLPMIRFDSSAAWDGNLGGEHVHVVAAAYRGTPVFFDILWDPADSTTPASGPPAPGIWYMIFQSMKILVMAAALLMARRNVRLGRSDRKGAARIAIAVLLVSLAGWFFTYRHAADPGLFDDFVTGLAHALFYGAYVYLAYLAFEPYVRRRWPNMLISWTRVLAGRFRDPRAGRDLLAGCVAGALSVVLGGSIGAAIMLAFHLPWHPFPAPFRLDYLAARGWMGSIGMFLICLQIALILGLAAVVVLLLGRFLTRRTWIAVVFWITTNAASGLALSGVIGYPTAVAALSFSVLCIAVLFRLGILGLTAAYFTSFLLSSGLLTTDPSHWYFRSSALVLIILAALVIHAFRSALAGRPAFGRALLED